MKKKERPIVYTQSIYASNSEPGSKERKRVFVWVIIEDRFLFFSPLRPLSQVGLILFIRRVLDDTNTSIYTNSRAMPSKRLNLPL